MNKLLIATIIGLITIPTTLAEVNMTTNVWADGDVSLETNINNTGDTSISINGVPWTYEPKKWTSGINVGIFGVISRHFYEPWVLSKRDYNLLYYLVDIVNKIVTPQIRELYYRNEVYEYMLRDLYKDKFKEKYCEAMSRVGNEHNLDYVICEDLICRESYENVWYCDKKLNENVTVGVYRFDFNQK